MSILLTTQWAEGVTGPPQHPNTNKAKKLNPTMYRVAPKAENPKELGSVMNDDRSVCVFSDMTCAL